jgi:hypothetical protein
MRPPSVLMELVLLLAVLAAVVVRAAAESQDVDTITHQVECTTTKGTLMIDVYRGWSPRGADRFVELIEDGFYNDIAFFRCVDGFLTQCKLV